MNLRTFLGSPLMQLPLPFGSPPTSTKSRPLASTTVDVVGGDAHALGHALSTRLKEHVLVEVHDNRSTMVSFKRRGEWLRLRLHHMFLPPAPTLPAVLADYVAGSWRRRAAAGRWLDQWIKEHHDSIRPALPPAVDDRAGRFHDLAAIFDALNRDYFDGSISAQIGWGRPAQKRRRRTIKMGVYLHDHRQIRIHPALDRADVPGYFVEFVVYHEMCHQACPPESSGKSRSRVHTARFRERERRFAERARALAWEKAHLGKLLHHN